MKQASVFALGCVLVFLALSSGPQALAGTYSTTFSATENPISEGGRWINGKTDGLDWSDIQTLNGFAFGLQPGPFGYDDSTAVLTGTWGPNQTVSAIVHTTNPDNSLAEEVEIRLRSSISPHRCTGYEVLFGLRTDASAYVAIVRWNGPVDDWTLLDSYGGTPYVLHEGDEIKGTITNQTIAAYINGVKVMQVTDGTFSTGSPGMGFYLARTTGVNHDYGFTSFTATDGLDGAPTITSQPQTQVAVLTANAVFDVTATGTAPLFYQWYFNVTNVLAGATNSQLILTNVGDGDAGWYSVSVSNSAGGIISDSAELILDRLPVIESQPQNLVVNVTSDATFAVTATGAALLFYQWFFNATNLLAGATNSQMILTNVVDEDAGWYSVSASNSAGAIMSDSAELVINHPPMPASPTLERYWGSGFQVQEAWFLGTDPDGDQVVLTAVETPSAQGGSVGFSQGSVYYMPPPGLTNDDSFSYTVEDGRGGLAAGTAMIVMLTNRGPSLNITLEDAGGTAVRLKGNGIADRLYTFEFAEDPGDPDWQPIGSAMSDEFGAFEYLDQPPVGGSSRFYKLSTCCAEAKAKANPNASPSIGRSFPRGGR